MKATDSRYHSGPFHVVRYPTYWVVADWRDGSHPIVFESRSREAAHRKADKLNREADDLRLGRVTGVTTR